MRATTFGVGRETLLVISYPAEEPAFDGLSRAESEVLRAALGGLSNTEIAAVRGRSRSTVENQLASAFRKLGVTTRVEAAALVATRTRR